MNKKILSVAIAATFGLLLATEMARAQVAGATTTVGATVVETTRMAMGWSAKKSILGKTVTNESGAKVGKVEDLIISPDKNVSYLIVGAGGFVGIGRHDVAVPVSQIQNLNGKLVMAGATKDSVKAMPRFEYTDDKADRTAFLLQADGEITKGKADIDALERKAQTATAEAKAAMATQMTQLKADLKAAEVQVSGMKSAAASRWKEFEAGVRTANARLRQSIDKAMG
jgi:sporulation protein YlmC with PRC-barrel domain